MSDKTQTTPRRTLQYTERDCAVLRKSDPKNAKVEGGTAITLRLMGLSQKQGVRSMTNCPKCGAPAGHSAPDGDFKYLPPSSRPEKDARLANMIEWSKNYLEENRPVRAYNQICEMYTYLIEKGRI